MSVAKQAEPSKIWFHSENGRLVVSTMGAAFS